jgi:hypothetical protein
VSLLNRVRRAGSNGHLDDEAFAEIWSASVAGGQPAADPHLAACQPCRTRYAAFTSWLDRLRDDAYAEADEAFPAERLAAQQAQVLRRLEALERPARVIAFPRFSRPVTSTQGHAQRWVAAAAAAGLVIGLAAGQFVDIRDALGGGGRVNSQVSQTARATPPALPGAPAVTPISVPAISDESLFFGDAVRNASYSPLQPMDDITPRARDIETIR